MGRAGFERVSQREYARRLGISNTAVANAIEEGKIVKGWDKKTKKILVEKANEEWGNIHITAKNFDFPADEVLFKPKPQAQKIPTGFEDETPEDLLKQIENFNINANTQFAEALRIEKVAKAKIAVLELKTKTGELVFKDEVYKQLFAFGQEVRQALLVVPDRCIDALIAAKNRSEAHVILTKELHEALEKLADANIDFQPRQ